MTTIDFKDKIHDKKNEIDFKMYKIQNKMTIKFRMESLFCPKKFH